MHKKKKVIIERKFRKTKRKIFIGIIVFCIGNILLLSVAGWFVFFNKPAIINPLSVSAHQSQQNLANPQIAIDQTKNLLNKYNIAFQSVNEDADIIKIQLPDDSEVWLTANKNIESQIASLQLTLNQFTIEGRKVKLIDFRFDKPVVSF